MNCDEFYPPPEAPVFEPSEEEFEDPLGYIAKIKPIAEKHGICKVRPPPHWQPPFAIDVENFEFSPRTQRLNELGVHTRIRLQFTEKIAKYWELQGTQFRLPNVAGTPLDLYGLHYTVKKLGGFAEVCSKKLWINVCEALKLAKSSSSQLKQHYEKLLYPYDILQSGILTDGVEDKSFLLPRYMGKMKSKMGVCGNGSEPTRRIKRRPMDSSLDSVDVSNNKELQKLQLFGAGPKMVGLGLIAKENNRLRNLSDENKSNVKAEINNTLIKQESNGSRTMPNEPSVKQELDTKTDVKTEAVKVSTRQRSQEQIPYSIIDTMDNCKACNKDDNDAQLLICEGCDDNYHTYCLVPPISVVPKGDWRCPKCIQKECNKKLEPYGFSHAGKKYTLQSFGEMADSFKSEYFTKPAHMVKTDVVEKEFWRLIGSLDEDVSVEYGADIHVLQHGSGFPRMLDKKRREMTSEEEEYAKSPWNLNNLPVEQQSLLKSMTGDISGMKCPWTYVGMCFSAFCFHIEDHWTYSINYLHWGEPKTWYGVPRRDAEKLENVMKNCAPDLFANHPDLMHHLVTTINPAVLMNNGVNVVRTNQCAGEFVITFPRAYHAGFNQGYNFAEAVNFCPSDWVSIGRSCIDSYRLVHRPCVFSHNEVICKVAGSPDKLDVQLAAAVYRDMLVMVTEEKELRQKVQELGVTESERVAFELDPDDERQCLVCKTTCFLSGLVCQCPHEKLTCLYHSEKLCSVCPPSKFILRYRYTLDELPPLVQKIKKRAESFDSWSENVTAALNSKDDKPSLEEFKDLIAEAKENKFPTNDLIHQLVAAVREGERCAKVAQQLVSLRKHRTRQKDNVSSGCSLTLSEIKAFHSQLLKLPCKISQTKQVSDYIDKVEEFLKEAEQILREEDATSEVILDLVEKSRDFDLDIPQIHLLNIAAEQAKWLEDVRESLMLDDENNEEVKEDDLIKKYPLITLEQLRQLIEKGASITPRRAVESALAELQELLNRSEAWEERASQYFDTPEKGDFVTAQAISEESLQVPVELPYCEKLQDAVSKAKLWTNKLQVIQSQDFYPYISLLEAMLLQAAPICINLKQVAMIETQAAAAKGWLEKTSKSFLKKNSNYVLLDVLKPRTQEILQCNSIKALKKRLKDNQTGETTFIEKLAKTNNIDTIVDATDPAEIVQQFKIAEQEEVKLLKELRSKNDIKSATVSGSSDESSIEKEGANHQTYCICHRPSDGLMLQCELCHDWFHTQCVPIPRLTASNKSKVQQMFELKFLCPLCQRSRRPKLETILSLLLQLQKLPVRIKEGEALQCVTERAMMWQEKAKRILLSPKYKALNTILDEQLSRHERLWQEHYNLSQASGHTRRLSSMESIDDTISNVIKRHASLAENDEKVNDLDKPVSESAPVSRCTSHEDMEAAEVLAMIASNHQTSPTPQDSTKESITPTDYPEKNGNMMSESEIIRELQKPILQLDDGTKAELENLMMEGDLMEVHLPEAQQLWKILQAGEPVSEDKINDLMKSHKKVQKQNTDTKVKKENVNINGKNNQSDEKKPKKQKQHGTNETKKKRKRKNNEALKALEAIYDDEYATCAIAEATENLATCRHPSGEEVDWVQCDGGCEGWFHCVCANITAEEAKEMDYICEKCKATQKKLKLMNAHIMSPRPASNFQRNQDTSHSQSGAITACVS